MRKHILILLLLCLNGMARGQTDGQEAYYWFDDQGGQLFKSHQVEGLFEVDASSLNEGIHTFHYIIMQDGGGLSTPTSCYFLKVPSSQPTASLTCFCTVDGQLCHQEQISSNGGIIHWNLDMSDVPNGLHFMQIDVLAQDGGLCNSSNSYFMKVPSSVGNTVKGYYWFDNETTPRGELQAANGVFEVDASTLESGFHTFYFLLQQDGGPVSVPTSSLFWKMESAPQEATIACLCSIDGVLRHQETISGNGGIIHWNLDLNDVSDGLHYAQVEAVASDGAVCNSIGTFFMRDNSHRWSGPMQCIYTIDNDTRGYVAGSVDEKGLYHFDHDLTLLDEGLHHITYMLSDGQGTNTSVQTCLFLKTPIGGNGITHYQYWLNEDEVSQAQTVNLPKKVNPLQLMTLLPAESRPFRSSLFRFDVSNGQPKVYAKNTIHLRFYDAAMRFTDATKDYADNSIGQDVSVIKELESGVRETTSWPEENEIKWYQVTAERGDSLSFKLDLAATLQLFSPSGKEVYSASGSEVVKWGGCHAEENGTFYLALHDVSATRGEDINIDYEHIDKYAVLRQDVSIVGNGGCSTITFEGNGYDELTSVDLVLGNNTITSVEIGHESNATTSVKFNFTNAALGQYKAVFHFKEGELTVEKCVKVEEAIDITFDLSVSYASQFLIGTSNDYIFKVQNNGNMTAYNVPMAILIYTPDSSSLSKIEINGYDTNRHIQELLKEQYTDPLRKLIAQKSSESGDLYFFKTADNVSYIDGHTYMHFAYITPTLRPNTTETYTINVKTTKKIYVYMWIPEQWENEDDIAGVKSRRQSKKSGCDQELKDSWLRCKDCYYEFQNTGGTTMCDGCIPPSPAGDCSNDDGGGSDPVNSLDPNDIFGYTTESGSHAVKDGLTDVYYRIEFENDPAFATAAAHEIIVTDTLDAMKFDLSTFEPTRVRIGEKSAELKGDKNYVTTIDMRPEINAIAQVEGTFDQKKGIAKWHISSLDPMTMEPTNDVMQGVLPVNVNGNGMGELMFDIKLKQDLADGTEIPNRASIVFDKNDAILTPTWVNFVDAVAPTSRIIEAEQVAGDSLLTLRWTGEDERSGIWHYDVYAQMGAGTSWELVAEHVTGNECRVRVFEDIEYGFCVVATDMAGNREKKVMVNELLPDVPENIASPVDNMSGTDANRYDLLGRRTDGSRTGVYIQNGQLIFVRH